MRKTGTTTPVVINATERRAFLMELRKTGASYRDIASAAIERYGMENLPKGWDSRYAYKDVMRVIKAKRKEMLENASDIIEIELERLDEMTYAVWNLAIQGDFKAIDRVLHIMARRAKLLGLDKTNLYLETDWKKEAKKKGVDAESLFEEIVGKFVDIIEQETLDGAEDAEYRDLQVVGNELEATTGGSVGGSSSESDTESAP